VPERSHTEIFKSFRSLSPVYQQRYKGSFLTTGLHCERKGELEEGENNIDQRRRKKTVAGLPPIRGKKGLDSPERVGNHEQVKGEPSRILGGKSANPGERRYKKEKS